MHVQSVQNYCFSVSNMQICGVLLPSSPWLLKFPTIKSAYRLCSTIIFPHPTNQINFSYSKYKKDDDLSLISLSTLKPSCPFVRNNNSLCEKKKPKKRLNNSTNEKIFKNGKKKNLHAFIVSL